MRPALGQLLVVLVILIVIAAILAAIIYGAIRIVRYWRRREADRREMLDLMREQNRSDRIG